MNLWQSKDERINLWQFTKQHANLMLLEHENTEQKLKKGIVCGCRMQELSAESPAVLPSLVAS